MKTNEPFLAGQNGTTRRETMTRPRKSYGTDDRMCLEPQSGERVKDPTEFVLRREITVSEPIMGPTSTELQPIT